MGTHSYISIGLALCLHFPAVHLKNKSCSKEKSGANFRTSESWSVTYIPAEMKPEEFLQKKRKDGPASPLELEVAKACAEITDSSSSGEARAAVSHLRIMKVKEIDVEASGSKALIVTLAYRPYKVYIQPNHQRCLTELEKKTKRHVVFVAARQMLRPKQNIKGFKARPFSRTLTGVHNSMLEDIVAPTAIVGKRLRIKTDGSQVHKIYLDPRDRSKDNVEEKLQTYSAVYASLTGKRAVFDFPEYSLRD